MKKINYIILLLLPLFASAQIKSENTGQEQAYTINFEGFNQFNGLAADLYYLSPMNIGDYDETQKVIIKDGKFSISGHLESVLIGNWGVYDGDDLKGRGKIIIEPGIHTVALKEDGDFNLKTDYNDIIFNNLKTYALFNEALQNLDAYQSKPNFSYKDSLDFKESYRLNKIAREIRSDYFLEIFENNPDPIIKALVLMENQLFYDYDEDKSGSERLTVLTQLIPDHYLVKTMEFYKIRSEETEEMKSSVGVGQSVKNFTAKDHDGNTFNLEDVLKVNNYVLVEFWASWCGPCRAAIPHLKEAYNKYKSKGFEIVSFSIDSKKALWDKAFKDEQIPWIDTSDLLAEKSPVAKMYGVVGVPASYLIDKEGNIIGAEMRGDKLDAVLKEVFED